MARGTDAAMMAKTAATKAQMSRKPLPPVFFVLGSDRRSGPALAEACGAAGEIPAFDPKGLASVLRQRRRVVVVWSSPAAELAAALGSGLALDAVAGAWLGPARALLGQSDAAAGRLVLVEAGAIWNGAGPALEKSLPLLQPPLAPPPEPVDALAALAGVILSLLPEVAEVLDRLRAASLTTGLAAPVDLEALADLGRDLARTRRERDLLRDQLHDLVSNLSAGKALPVMDQSSQVAPLQAQHVTLAENVNDARQMLENASAAQNEISLLRAQLRALDALLSAAHPPNADWGSGQTGTEARSKELHLLRDQLSHLQAAVASGDPDPAPRQLPSATLTSIEAAMARLLSDLVQETERRLIAEREAHLARITLRRLDRPTAAAPTRIPVAARPLS